MRSGRSSWLLVAVFCLAEAASMAGFALVPSLLPKLSLQWRLSATQAGWLSGFFFLGYLLAVPVLVSLTDRMDARRVYLASAAVGGLAQAGFAAFADGLVGALGWWWLTGLGLAGTYMPGLKALTDRLPVAVQSRGTAFYTATFGVGAGLSYLWVELLQSLLPWRTLFVVGAAGSLLAVVLVWLGVAAGSVAARRGGMREHWWNVMRERRILAYCGGYFGHNWELFGFRAWLVAYLSWQQAHRPDVWTSMPGLVAAGATFLAVPASVLGNEGAHRWGRRRWLTRVMPLSCVLALLVSLSGDLPRALLVGLLLVYAMSMNLDSAALTAGVLTETAVDQRGTALALYSSVGFAGGLLGPVVFGVAVDACGGPGSVGWTAGFVTLAGGVAFGRWAIGRIERSPAGPA